MKEIRLFVPVVDKAEINDWLNNPLFFPEEDFLTVPVFSADDQEQLVPTHYTRHLHSVSDSAFIWLKDFENYFPGLVILESGGLSEYEFMDASLTSQGLALRRSTL